MINDHPRIPALFADCLRPYEQPEQVWWTPQSGSMELAWSYGHLDSTKKTVLIRVFDRVTFRRVSRYETVPFNQTDKAVDNVIAFATANEKRRREGGFR